MPDINNSFNNVKNSEINITISNINPSELVTHIKKENIDKSKQLTSEQKEILEKKFYFIDDSYKTIFDVVCNDIEIKNQGLLYKLDNTISGLNRSAYWLLGNGGEGKSTTLVRLAVQSVLKDRSSFYIDFENSSLKEDSVLDMILFIQKNTVGKAYIFIDNPDIKVDVLKVFFKEIEKSSLDFILVLAERKNRYDYLKYNDKSAIYLNHQIENENFILLTISKDIKREVYKRFYSLLGKKDTKIEEIINTTIDQKGLAFVNATYKILYELSKEDKEFISYKFDWIEYEDIAKDNFNSLRDSYKYIALFYYFRIKMPFSFLENIYQDNELDLKNFTKYFSNTNKDETDKEPIVFDTVKINAFKKIYYMRAKHEIIAELFFDDIGFSQEDFTELFINILKVFDGKDKEQSSALLQLFGNKRIHNDKNRRYKIDFSFIDDLIDDNNLIEQFKENSNLFGSIYLTRFWELLKSDENKAIEFLKNGLKIIPNNLHFRTELAKVYQQNKEYKKAENVLLECIKLSPKDLNSRTELAKVYQQNREYKKAENVLLECIKLSPKDLNSRTELAKVYQQNREYKKAENVLLECIKLSPKDLNSRTELAKVYQSQKKYDEAEKVLLELLDKDKNNLQARTELAKVYQTQKKYDEAEKVLLESLVIDNKQLHPRTN